jgi:CDP-diacylglycerol--glycerol-3-phosphate 3-phosphatidyltransferase
MSEWPSAWVASPALTWVPLITLMAVFVVTLAIFAIGSAVHGRPRSARASELGGSVLLGGYLIDYGLWALRPVVRLAVRLELHPDALTWTALLLQLLAGVSIGLGGFGLGGWLMLVGAACDSLDGSVARARGLVSQAGEVLDSTLDRWADMAAFFGYAFYYRDRPVPLLLALGACAGAVMVSYVRAKGEGVQVKAKIGLMQRHERAVYLVIATVASAIWELVHPAAGRPLHAPVIVALALIALLGNITGLQRLGFVRRELRKR